MVLQSATYCRDVTPLTPLLSNLDSLIGLARYDGIDVRPTLLRVLTDLYVQKPTHSAEEEQHYTELALRLIEAVDIITRKTVADRLVKYPAAPLAVLRRLACDIAEFAKLEMQKRANEPAIPHDPRSTVTASAIMRLRPPTRTVPTPACALFASSAPTSMVSHGNPVVHANAQPLAGERHANARDVEQRDVGERDIGERDIGEVFYAATPEKRRIILLETEISATAPAIAAQAPPRAIAGRLEAAALGGRPDIFINELEQALNLSRASAQRIVNDTSGEPMAVAAKALAMPIEVFQRIVLFINPAIGRSIERVYSLSALYEELPADAALRLVAIWRRHADAPSAPAAVRRHQPVLWDDERRGAREAASPAPRRHGTASQHFSVGGRQRTT
jgi:hypothetical protein